MNEEQVPSQESIFSEGTREYYADQIRKDSVKALVFGILSIFCCPPIFAYFGYTSAEEALTNIAVYEVEQSRKGMAVAGKVLCIAGIVLWVVGIILRIAVAVT